jgi:hypothetical protein
MGEVISMDKRMEKLLKEAKKKEINGVPVEIEFTKDGKRMRCVAKSKSSGEQCRNWSEHGQKVCRFHGGKTPKKTEEQKAYLKGNVHRLTHGIYSNQLLTPEESDFYHDTMEAWTEEYGLDEANQLVLDRALKAYIKQCRKDIWEMQNEGGSMDKGVMIDNDAKFQKYIQMLGLDRKFNMTLQKEEKIVHDIASLLSGLAGEE